MALNTRSALSYTHQVLPGVEVTVGSDQDPAAQAINSAGAKHIATSVTVSFQFSCTDTALFCLPRHVPRRFMWLSALSSLTCSQEVHVDSRAKVVTTPAYMCEAPLHQIFDGIGNMISAVMKFIK